MRSEQRIMMRAMLRGRTRLDLALAAVALAALILAAGHDYVESAAFVIRAAGMQGALRRAASFEAEPVAESSVSIPWRGGTLRGRAYLPAEVDGRAILLVPGVHAAGIDEPRLASFARELAASGHPVTTAELPDLMRYSVTPRSTDMIEDAGRWLAGAWRDRMAPSDRRVGLVGISFAGGLSVVAASRTTDTAAWVLSFGGHGDLPRTLRYLCTGQLPDGSIHPPHDYGVAIILLGVADRLVPPEQVDPLRESILAYLHASNVDVVDKAQGAQAFGRAKALADRLPDPARGLMARVIDRDVAGLGPLLLPHVAALGSDPSLSPERNPPPHLPVYLLHGADDNVVPPSESRLLADYLRRGGGTVTVLVSPLITHADVDHPPALAEIWRLIGFWAGPL